jgi:hypothetical protein
MTMPSGVMVLLWASVLMPASQLDKPLLMQQQQKQRQQQQQQQQQEQPWWLDTLQPGEYSPHVH